MDMEYSRHRKRHFHMETSRAWHIITALFFLFFPPQAKNQGKTTWQERAKKETRI